MPKIPSNRKNKIDDPRNIDDTLDEMYQEDDGSRPDMKHIVYKKSRAGLVVVFFILFFMASAAAAAWLGFFLFSPSQKFSENQVVAEITPPNEIVNGIEQDYTITIRNDGSLALANTRVSLKLPENFIVTDSEPDATSERNDGWSLGAIDGEQSKTITLKAVYGKPKDTKENLRVFVDYKPSNFNSEFEKIVDEPIEVTKNSVEIALSKKSVDGKNQLEVVYKNIAEQTITNALIGVDAGSSFKMTKAQPPAKILAGVITLQIPELLANKEGKFLIDGGYSASSTPPVAILANITRKFNGKTIEIAKFELANEGGSPETPTQTSPAKSLSIASNSESVKPGDQVRLTITYKNTTDKPVTNVAMTLVGVAPSVKNKSIFDYTNLATIGDPDVVGRQINPDKREAKITWSPEKTAVLKEIAPGQQVVIELNVGVKTLESAPKETEATYTLSLSGDNDTMMIADPISISTK